MKYVYCNEDMLKYKSPSMRREWIEMPSYSLPCSVNSVSLHAEGVD